MEMSREEIAQFKNEVYAMVNELTFSEEDKPEFLVCTKELHDYIYENEIYDSRDKVGRALIYGLIVVYSPDLEEGFYVY